MKDLKFLKSHPMPTFLVCGTCFFLMLFLPAPGFGDINEPLRGVQSILKSVVSRGSPLFWILMSGTLSCGGFAAFRGNWKMVITALMAAIILGNFEGTVNTLLKIQIIKESTDQGTWGWGQ